MASLNKASLLTLSGQLVIFAMANSQFWSHNSKMKEVM